MESEEYPGTFLARTPNFVKYWPTNVLNDRIFVSTNPKLSRAPTLTRKVTPDTLS